MKTSRIAFGIVALVLIGWSASAATIVIVNKDGAGVGFNDTTAATPVGGNSGTTLGAQRLIVFQQAAAIWGAKLSSPVTIKVQARFGPLTPCEPTFGVLGSAGPTNFVINFTNAPRLNTWYPIALASALDGVDYAAALPDGASISASFNSNVGVGTCLTTTSWYLGLDSNEGTKIDLLATVLHEFGHGLGFTGLVDLTTGALSFDGRPDVYSVYTHDNSVSMNWTAMSDGQRVTSSTNNGNVAFDGTNTTASAATVLTVGKDGSQHPKLYTPSSLEQGSSVYHFDTSASPNQLMEPSINHDLTSNVDVPNDLTTKVMLDLGWAGMASAPNAPGSVVATATSATSVSLTWTAGTGATSYRVYRTPNNSTTYSMIASGIGGTAYTDTTATGNNAYLYKVRSFNGSSESVDSNVDLATTVIFTDPSLATGTIVKAAHFNELRTAVAAVRTLAGSGTTTFTDALSSSVNVQAIHLTELRSYLNGARITLGVGSWTFTDNTITPQSSTIRALHITDLRDGVQ